MLEVKSFIINRNGVEYKVNFYDTSACDCLEVKFFKKKDKYVFFKYEVIGRDFIDLDIAMKKFKSLNEYAEIELTRTLDANISRKQREEAVKNFIDG